ncbi:DEAD/DEAH box helicase family protein [Geodermatophilus sp. YIM 151500]|uniref:DEAD/DEAH box helicase family protein n=1 Tax=Geodermatophilus sp. YIM 151500 TaxID=2984531 RepID=UPI0021E45D98|nr:DEAD/DEAH box helicase family protein [Geodermatophilus sp. YIM 151500]MCV2491848.1 DEAD/DEAH box helicase family protein [Geodermatophilus sp. YIM 151500]
MPGRRKTSTTTTRRRSSASGSRRSAPQRTPAPRKTGPTTGTSTRTGTSATSRPPLPAAGPGERVHVLAVPFRAPAPGAAWHPGLQAHVWVGRALPAELAGYASRPYTVESFIEDELNGVPGELPPSRPLEPRPLQLSGAAAVVAHADAGGRVFLLGDDPGVGKTGTAILAARRIAAARGGGAVLVVADRPAAITIAHWTRSIAGFGDGGLRWCVTTWDRLAKVAAATKLTGRRFDVVVADEAHMVRHTTTQRWKLWKTVSGAGRVKDAPFVLAATATPAHTPLELPYLAPELAVRAGEPLRAWGDLPERLVAHGFHVERGRYGWAWTEDAGRRRADLARLQGLLTAPDAGPPATLHRSAPWGPVSVTGAPVALTPDERAAYESGWQEFRAEMRLARRRRETARGRAALLRFRQKAGLIRVQATVDWVRAQVEAERQVAVSVEFVETAADPIRAALLAAGIPVAGIYGRDRFDVEAERLRFQRGEAAVCVFTVTASISLHAGELLAGSAAASALPRVGLFHQPRFSGIQARQVTGRTHRDGQVSPWRVAYAEDTVEEQVARVMVERLAVSGSTAGADTSALREIAELLDADWLPPAALTDAA